MGKQDYAFPSENDDGKQYNWINKGMTLRDYFAAKAMQALLAKTGWSDFKDITKGAYVIADDMIKQREIER